MSGGIYVAYTGALASQLDLEVIANNLANSATAGFRRDQTQFDTLYGAALAFNRASTSAIDLAPASQQLTGDPLHGAIDGDGFFTVEGPDGQELYTRRGDFRIDASGRLVLPNGMAVLGEGGPLVVPPGAVARLGSDGTLSTEDGPIGRLRMMSFDRPESLWKAGESLIGAGPEAEARAVEDARLAVGHVEGSNVNLAHEMVALIQTTRSFEASMRSIQIHDELTQKLVDTQRG